MSSRRSSSKRGGSSYYPTQWSEWEWNAQNRCWQRYRLKGPDEYEYDYSPAQAEDDPRTVPPFDPTVQSSQPAQYTSSVSYTTAPAANVEDITRGLSQSTLGPSSHLYTQSTQTLGPSLQLYPQSTQSGSNYITTRNPYTTEEEFDPHYKVHDAWQFKWGRVFKVLWTEPRGNGGNGSTGGGSTSGTYSERPGRHGEVHHEKVRRFVIINAFDGHCICLPIMTYGGQGVNKRGVHAKHHTIIYTTKTAVAFKGEREKGLTKKPIRVEPSSPRHKLDSASRLNYAKPYTVEYNVKVWFIGKVHPNSEWQLGTDYNRVHPPLEPRGEMPTEAEEGAVEHAQGGIYPTGYFSSAGSSFATSSSYPAGSGYQAPISSLGTNQASYTAPGYSTSYTSGPALDPVSEVQGEYIPSNDPERPSSHGHEGHAESLGYGNEYVEPAGDYQEAGGSGRKPGGSRRKAGRRSDRRSEHRSESDYYGPGSHRHGGYEETPSRGYEAPYQAPHGEPAHPPPEKEHPSEGQGPSEEPPQSEDDPWKKKTSYDGDDLYGA